MAVSADAVEDMASLQTKLPELTLLSDRKLEATAAWGVLWTGAEQPSPATFVVTRDRHVKWRHTPTASGDWPTYDQVRRALGA